MTKKTKTKSFKLTEEQEQIINEKAKERGISASQYILESCIKNNTLTPEFNLMIEEIYCDICYLTDVFIETLEAPQYNSAEDLASYDRSIIIKKINKLKGVKEKLWEF